MNLLFLNSAREWGGTEKWVVNTALGLAGRGHTVYFGCRGDLFDARFTGSAVRPVKFPFANNLDFVTLALIRSFIRKNRIDVVLPSKQREYFLAGLAAKLGTRARVAGMFGIDRPIRNMRNRIAFRHLFDIVLVVAKKIIDVLALTRGFDPGKCRVVYVGVEQQPQSADIRQKIRKTLGILDHEVCIMGIGRLTPQKGFDYAIKAFALLAERYPHAKLVIAGGGDSAPYQRLAQDLKVASRVIFTGFRTDIAHLIEAADVYWMTSRSEGIPNTMLETMAAGVPVVAFDIAGVSEVLVPDENGLVVMFENCGAVADQTARLLGDRTLMRRIAENGRKTVATEYSLSKMCDDTEGFLMELLKTGEA